MCDVEAAAIVCDVRASDDLPYKAAWDPTGTCLALTSRDRVLKLLDPRAPKAAVAAALAHEGKAPMRALFVDVHTLLTVGASLSSERQIRHGIALTFSSRGSRSLRWTGGLSIQAMGRPAFGGAAAHASHRPIEWHAHAIL